MRDGTAVMVMSDDCAVYLTPPPPWRPENPPPPPRLDVCPPWPDERALAAASRDAFRAAARAAPELKVEWIAEMVILSAI